jgi:hypothetical protein
MVRGTSYKPARTAAPIYANLVAGLSETNRISGGAVHMAGAMGTSRRTQHIMHCEGFCLPLAAALRLPL